MAKRSDQSNLHFYNIFDSAQKVAERELFFRTHTRNDISRIIKTE